MKRVHRESILVSFFREKKNTFPDSFLRMTKKYTLLLPGHLDLEGLFLVNGNAERVDWLRQRYDSGEEVELEKEADLASAVSLLRLFLQELPEPVIPTEIQRHILQLHQGVCPLFCSPPPHPRFLCTFHSLCCSALSFFFYPVSSFFFLFFG